MGIKYLVTEWFKRWEEGDFLNLPISENFNHTSPFGTIKGKAEYISLVKENKDKFLGYSFEIQDQLYYNDRACVRYKAVQGDFRLEVSEWYYCEKDLIKSIISYYHIGEIKADRQLKNL